MIKPGYTYTATVVKIVDADTVDVDMDLGFHVHIKVRCRLARVSAPELQTPEGKIAKGITAMWLPLGKIIYVISKSVDRYGRSIAEITVDGKNLTDGLIAERSDLFLPYK